MHGLRILDDQQADAAHARLVRHEALQAAAAIGLVGLFEGEAELTQDLLQEVARRDVVALDRSGDDALVEIFQQPFDQQALAAAVVRGDHTEPGVGPQRMSHELQRPQVLIAGEKERFVVVAGERSGREPEPHGLVQESRAFSIMQEC